MIIIRTLNIFYQLFVLLTIIKSIFCQTHQQDQTSNQLFNILGSLQPFRSQFCQFKFENCIQDSSYADQLDNDCNIYSRLRDCFRSLLDETQCLTIQLKRQYKKAKQNEYDSCGIALSLESIQPSVDTSSSLKIMKQPGVQDIGQQLQSAVFSSGLTTKLICLFCIIGYFLSFSSQCVRALAVIPGRVMPPHFWVWTFLTHSFIELHIWHTIIDVIVVFLYSKMIEPLWGTKELLKFYFIVTIPNALFVTFIYFLFYGLTFNEDYLFERPIYGLAAFIGAYSVVIKQIMPDTVLTTTPLFKVKQDHVPLLIVLLSIILWLVHAVPIHFLIMLSFGIFISWTYLRFFQPHSNGTKGDMSASFSFANFFPSIISPIISVFANTIFELLVKIKLCKPFIKKYNVAAPSNITITIPGPEAADADRRRQKALKALNDRMKIKETTTEIWPELDETQKTSLIAQTHQTQNSSVTIDMTNSNELTSSITKEDLNQPYFDIEQQSTS